MSNESQAKPPQFDEWVGITRTIATYARLADERRADEMASLFTPDGRLLMFRPRQTEPAETAVGRDELANAFRALDRFSATSHFLGPSVIDCEGDTASAHTYCMSHHIADEAEGRRRYTLADRYIDTLILVDGHWLFQERRKYTDWTESAPLKL